MGSPEHAPAAPAAAIDAVRYRSPLPTRYRMRWQALKATLAVENWRPRTPPPSGGFASERVEDALREACGSMGLVILGEPVQGEFTRSLGAMVRTAEGTLRWLKVNGVLNARSHPQIDGEKLAAALRGIPKPAILEIREWTERGVHWCAFLMTLTPETAKPQPFYSRHRAGISDQWIAELKQALRAIAAIPTRRTRCDPDWVATTIVDRFGIDAPLAAADWRTAHGDLQWGNLTAPELMLLDWGLWGRAPRGFDAARLIAFTSPDDALTRRLLAAFADDLETASGKVAQLAVFAEQLAIVEAGYFDPRFHAPIEALARRALGSE